MFGEFWGAAVLVKKKRKKVGVCRIFGALTWTVEQDKPYFGCVPLGRLVSARRSGGTVFGELWLL